MENIRSVTDLKKAIQLLENEQTINWELLKGQLSVTYESFKPLNLIKRTLEEVTSSPYLVNDVLSTAIGLTAGYISKKIFVGRSGNIARKFLGTLIQLGVTNVTTQRSEVFKTMGQFLFKHLFRKKE